MKNLFNTTGLTIILIALIFLICYLAAYRLDIINSILGAETWMDEYTEPMREANDVESLANREVKKEAEGKSADGSVISVSPAFSTIEATVTAYCLQGTTAYGIKVHQGIIANNQHSFGTKVEIDGKIYTLEDRMNKRFPKRWDIWFESCDEAIHFGIQTKQIKIYEQE